jgi:hypothetical protein
MSELNVYLHSPYCAQTAALEFVCKKVADKVDTCSLSTLNFHLKTCVLC